MLIVGIVIIGSFVVPIVYIIVNYIVDSISYKIKAIRWKKFKGEVELLCFTTNNTTITEEHIMLLFMSQIKKYQQRNFIIKYHVFDGKDEQNFAWSIKATKQTYGWGVIYNICFYFSNGLVYVLFSKDDFYSGSEITLPYYLEGRDIGTMIIEGKLNACRDEANIMWKVNGIEPNGNFPFDYIPLSGDEKSSSGRSKKDRFNWQNEDDMLAFYRNLLGLKSHFSLDELRKSYREAAVKYHPDRYGASSSRDRENAEILMKQINEAYEKLKEIAE